MKTKTYLFQISNSKSLAVRSQPDIDFETQLDKHIAEKSQECHSDTIVGFSTRFVEGRYPYYEVVLVFDISKVIANDDETEGWRY